MAATAAVKTHTRLFHLDNLRIYLTILVILHHFTLVADVEPAGLYKLLGPLFGWMGRRRNQADVEKLCDILESTLD